LRFGVQACVYFAGHMATAYLVGRPLAWASFSLPLLFAAAIAPDLDLLFSPIFAHHTITHSLTFWLAAYAPLFVVFRGRAAPYAIATFSHFLIGDIFTGNPPLLFGISDARFGAIAPWMGQQGALPLYQSAVDLVASSIFAVAAFRSIKPVWAGGYDPLHVLLLLAIVALVFFGASRIEIVSVLRQPNEMLYVPYGLVALSHVIFVLPFFRPLRKKELQQAPA
jgi:hypothetical protein